MALGNFKRFPVTASVFIENQMTSRYHLSNYLTKFGSRINIELIKLLDINGFVFRKQEADFKILRI